MKKYKKLEFVIIEHSLLKPLTIKEAILFKIIFLKASNKKLNQFPFNKTYLHEISGISLNTISKALKKFENLEIINRVENKIYLTSNDLYDFFSYFDGVYREREQKIRLKEITFTPTINFNFDLCKKLNLNEIDYAILHTYYTLSERYGYSFISIDYFIRNFGIKERQFKYIKSKLIHEKLIYKKDRSHLIYINEEIKRMFKNCTSKKDD